MNHILKCFIWRCGAEFVPNILFHHVYNWWKCVESSIKTVELFKDGFTPNESSNVFLDGVK